MCDKSSRGEELRQETEGSAAPNPEPVRAPRRLRGRGEEPGALLGTAAGEETQGALSEKGSHATRPNFNHSRTCGMKITPQACHLPYRAP